MSDVEKTGGKRKKNMSPEALRAWAAGFFDGEGTLALRPVSSPNCDSFFLLVRVTNMQRSALETLQAEWGGQIYTHKARGNRNTYYEWSIASRNAAKFLTDIQEFLQLDKNIDRVELALQFQNTKKPGRIPSNELESRKETEREFNSKIVELNRRGVCV